MIFYPFYLITTYSLDFVAHVIIISQHHAFTFDGTPQESNRGSSTGSNATAVNGSDASTLSESVSGVSKTDSNVKGENQFPTLFFLSSLSGPIFWGSAVLTKVVFVDVSRRFNSLHP